MERGERKFQGWSPDTTKRTDISKDIIASTEGQLPPSPKFNAPPFFTDLDGVTYKYQAPIREELNPNNIQHIYYVPGENPVMSKVHRLIKESYLKDVLSMQAQEAERMRQANERTGYENGYLTHGE